MLELIEVQPPPAPKRRSASQLESFLRCPEAYRLERIAKAPQNQAAWLTQGIAFHDCIEKWERTGRIFPLEEVLKWFDAAWDKTLGEQLDKAPDVRWWLTGGRKDPQKDIDDRYNLGREQVKGYIEYALATADQWWIYQPAPDMYAVEVEFDLMLNGVRVVGYIDQLVEWASGQITVRDLKTGTKIPATPRQLGIYRIAAKHTLDLDIDWGDFYMCKNNAPTKPYALDKYTPERVGRWFRNLDAAVTDGLYTPNPGDHCRICAVERFCDLLGKDSHLYPPDPAPVLVSIEDVTNRKEAA